MSSSLWYLKLQSGRCFFLRLYLGHYKGTPTGWLLTFVLLNKLDHVILYWSVWEKFVVLFVPRHREVRAQDKMHGVSGEFGIWAQKQFKWAMLAHRQPLWFLRGWCNSKVMGHLFPWLKVNWRSDNSVNSSRVRYWHKFLKLWYRQVSWHGHWAI